MRIFFFVRQLDKSFLLLLFPTELASHERSAHKHTHMLHLLVERTVLTITFNWSNTVKWLLGGAGSGAVRIGRFSFPIGLLLYAVRDSGNESGAFTTSIFGQHHLHLQIKEYNYS